MAGFRRWKYGKRRKEWYRISEKGCGGYYGVLGRNIDYKWILSGQERYRGYEKVNGDRKGIGPVSSRTI